jgi:phenylacetaldehyde dehydrogenase
MPYRRGDCGRGERHLQSGQCCCAGSRLFTHEKVYDKVVPGVAEIASKVKVGPGTGDRDGPLAPSEQFDGVTGYIRSGRDQGARAPGCDRRRANQGPRLFRRADRVREHQAGHEDHPEEIFGPVVCAQRFDEDDLDLVAEGGQRHDIRPRGEHGRATAAPRAHKLAQRIRSGTVRINCHNVFDASLPFGGYKQSGRSREMGEEVLDN